MKAKAINPEDDLNQQSTRAGSLSTMMEQISANITTIRNSVMPNQFSNSQFLNKEELLLKDKYIEEVNRRHLEQILTIQQDHYYKLSILQQKEKKKFKQLQKSK